MILPASPHNIERVSEEIRGGGIAAFPTETVYGLGANAWDGIAVRKVFACKGRPSFHPLIAHIPSINELDWVAALPLAPDIQSRLNRLSILWPGPLTVIVPRSDRIAPEVTGGRATIAVRVPSHGVAQDLLRSCACPIAAPSANRFGSVSPTCAQHVQDDYPDRDLLILDGGDCAVGLESTIISLLGPCASLLRPGGIPSERIAECLGIPLCDLLESGRNNLDSREDDALHVSGMLPHHYAPHTPLYFSDSVPAHIPPSQSAYVSFSPRPDVQNYCDYVLLSQTGSVEDIARKLFATLRALDKKRFSAIVVDRCEEAGLGRAVLDRLTKAANKFSGCSAGSY